VIIVICECEDYIKIEAKINKQYCLFILGCLAHDCKGKENYDSEKGEST
jgi:hypothetical protein